MNIFNINIIDLIYHPQVLLETLLPLLAIFAIALTIYHKYTIKKKQKQHNNNTTKYEDADYQIIRTTYMWQNDIWVKTDTKIVYGNNDYSTVLKEYNDNVETKYKDDITRFTPTKQYMVTFKIIMQEMHID